MSLLSPPLQAFVAVSREGAVHRAAVSLHLTQTGVTQRIRSLERDLGATLFTRSRAGMRLTAEGEALLRYCRASEDLEGATLSWLRKAGEEQDIHVTLAGPTSVTSTRVVQQCVPVYSRWPRLHLNFLIDDQSRRTDFVRNGRADLAVVSPHEVPLEMSSKTLKPERFLLVASSRWKGRRLSEILGRERIIDFYENDPTTLSYLRHFGLADQIGRPRLYVNNNHALIRLFIEGVGFGTLTQEVAQSYLASGDLYALNSGAAMEEALALIWYERPQMPAYLRSVIGAVK